jgi:hypothetical protein
MRDEHLGGETSITTSHQPTLTCEKATRCQARALETLFDRNWSGFWIWVWVWAALCCIDEVEEVVAMAAFRWCCSRNIFGSVHECTYGESVFLEWLFRGEWDAGTECSLNLYRLTNKIHLPNTGFIFLLPIGTGARILWDNHLSELHQS